MKKSFREYHVFTEKELDKLWNEAIIVLDTSVLLDFYCFGDETLNDYYTVLKAVKKHKQLWMPYQVGYELFNRRIGVINRQLKQYDNILSYLTTAQQQISNLTNTALSHAHLDFDDIARKYQDAVQPIKEEVEKLKRAHPDHLGNDQIITELEKIFTDSVIGSGYSDEELEKIYKEGEDRYSKRMPPGFKDQAKQDNEEEPVRNRKFGDLVIWKQMIEKAKAENRSIIFVTNDAKDDWVLYTNDRRRLGAKPQLKKEMLASTGVDFVLYSSDEFLDIAHKQLNLKVKTESVDEVKKYREREVDRINHQQYIPAAAYAYGGLAPWEELRYFAHHGRELARDCMHIITGEARSRWGVVIDNLYRELYEISSIVDQNPETAENIAHITDKLRHCYHLVQNLRDFRTTEVNELRQIILRMLMTIDRDSAL